MICAFLFHRGDVRQLHELLRWIEQLGGCKGHDALLVADAATPYAQCAQAKALASSSFREVRCVSNAQSVTGWPAGPNSLFRAAAEYIRGSWQSPWLLMETDCVPLRSGWLDVIAQDYQSQFASYLGCRYQGLDTVSGRPVQAFSGVAVYPASAAVELEFPGSQPFDMANRELLLRDGTPSPLIHHFYGTKAQPPTFVENKHIGLTYALTLKDIPPQAVLFHRNKDGTLLRLLRQKCGLPEPVSGDCFICLGRFGDLMIVLPALKLWSERHKTKPPLLVSFEYAPLLEGVSYVKPVVVRGHWWTGMPRARALAEREFGGGTVLQCHGHDWGINMAKWPNFQTSMWDRTGIEVELMKSTPLVFDRRNAGREAALRKLYLREGKPVLLYNFTGVSSPFPHTAQVARAIQSLALEFQLVDLGRIRAERIYDLLGLYDHAACLITTDTATLHLAAASKVPFVALKVGGWNTSVPVGNCILEMDYAEVPARIGEIVPAIRSTHT